MNANQIMNMVVRIFVKKLVGRGVNAGIDRAFGGGKSRKDMSPEERRQAGAAKKTGRHARRAMRIARRFGK